MKLTLSPLPPGRIACLSALSGLLGTLAWPAMAQMAPSLPPTTPEATAFVATAADAATLDSLRGGAQQVANDMTLNGTTADNSARFVNTGNNTIDNGSFANMSGLPVVIQNTGANVLIQNATIIHVDMN